MSPVSFGLQAVQIGDLCTVEYAPFAERQIVQLDFADLHAAEAADGEICLFAHLADFAVA